ncbi:MAG: pyridoxal 5'-phosphate synthase glutaminase subunit PdxT [Dehalococcoidia bacterium]
MNKVGVLALQGGFLEHIAALHRLGAGAFPVRLPKELKGLGGLVIPGGESTTIGKLMKEYHLEDELNKLIAEGVPVFGTCAGMVLLARKVSGMDMQPLGAMDIEVRRNAFGRQVDSFEVDLEVPVLGQHPFHAVFIRAPLIERVGGSVEILASLPDGTPVAARENNLVATAFHPELTTDLRFHEYFLTIVDDKLKAKAA